MLEIGRGLDFGQEPLSTDDRSQLWLQNLERDLALVPKVVSEVDRRHPALAELALDPVETLEGRVQTDDRVRAVHALNMRCRPLNREQNFPRAGLQPTVTRPSPGSSDRLWSTPPCGPVVRRGRNHVAYAQRSGSTLTGRNGFAP